MEWISVKDRLPNFSGELLINTDTGVDLGRYYLNTREFKSLDRPLPNFSGAKVLRQDLKPTHWMPLPDPPKSD